MPGHVQPVEPVTDGYGFNIWDEANKFALTLVFPTFDEAEDAAEEMKAILELSIYARIGDGAQVCDTDSQAWGVAVSDRVRCRDRI